jgi:hypothetical protein
MSETIDTPQPLPLPPSTSSSAAITSIVLGVIGLVCCGGLTGPFAWWLGAKELRAVNEHRSAESNRPLATIGMVLGIVGTVVLVLSIVWVAFFGGLAILAALAGAAGA